MGETAVTYTDSEGEPLQIGDYIMLDDDNAAQIHELMVEADGTQYCYVMTRAYPYYRERRDGPNGYRELELRCDKVYKVVATC